MRATRGWARWFIGPLAIIILLVVWSNVGPKSLGGDSVYMVTSGISMEPRFHSGDLAVLQPASSYSVGEIVGYHSPHIGVVLHRIIGVENGRFVMKGDHNNFVDTYHPSPSDVVGRLVLHVPKVGELVSTPRGRDTGLAVLGLSMVGLVGVPTLRERRRSERARRRTDDHGTTAWQRPLQSDEFWGVLGLPGQAAVSFLIVVALAALVLGVDGFTHSPLSRLATSTTYQQDGVWSYVAPASGTVYPSHVATTGDPLYETVAPVVHLTFAYSLVSTLPTTISGTGFLEGEVTASNGWSHPVSLGPSSALHGSRGVLSGVVNLPSLSQYLLSVEAQTGQGSGSALTYSLVIQPHVTASGTVGLRPVTLSGLSAPLVFSLLPGEADLVVNAPTSSLQAVTHPSLAGTLAGTTLIRTPLVIFGVHVTVPTVRLIVWWTLGATVVLLALLAGLVRRARRAPESVRIVSQYGDTIVRVKGLVDWTTHSVTEVYSMADLVRIAEFHGRLVLLGEDEGGPVFMVRDSSQTYRYQPEDRVTLTSSRETVSHHILGHRTPFSTVEDVT